MAQVGLACFGIVGAVFTMIILGIIYDNAYDVPKRAWWWMAPPVAFVLPLIVHLWLKAILG